MTFLPNLQFNIKIFWWAAISAQKFLLSWIQFLFLPNIHGKLTQVFQIVISILTRYDDVIILFNKKNKQTKLERNDWEKNWHIVKNKLTKNCNEQRYHSIAQKMTQRSTIVVCNNKDMDSTCTNKNQLHEQIKIYQQRFDSFLSNGWLRT